MKITDGVHLIDGTMANCYFIENDGKGILIDAGTKGSAKKILEFLKSNSFKLDTVLITHYHMDHRGGLARVHSALKPKIYVPDLEVDVVKGKEKPKSSNTFMSKMVGSIAHPEPVEDVLPASKFKSDSIEVIETHGHTPGSTSYFLKEKGILFVGDALVNSNGELKINKTFTQDFDEAEKSRKTILESGAKLILSGHGQPYELKD